MEELTDEKMAAMLREILSTDGAKIILQHEGERQSYLIANANGTWSIVFTLPLKQ